MSEPGEELETVDGDPDEDDDEEKFGDLPKAVRQKVEAFIPELVKKTFTAGMGAVFSTEEGIRRVTKEMTLPKDVAGYLANTASSTKDEVVKIIAREVREFLQSVNISEEIAKMLTTLSFEIKTEIRFIPNEEKYYGVEPDVKAKVRLKQAIDKRRKRRPLRRSRKASSAEAESSSKPDEPAEEPKSDSEPDEEK
jgi:hypothetical protein